MYDILKQIYRIFQLMFTIHLSAGKVGVTFMCNLSVKELNVYNYRKFEQVSYQLNPRMNVFAGKNGSGKTALLEAVNVVLGAYLAAFKTYVPSRFVYNISKDDAHLKVQTAEDSAVMTTGGIRQFPCRVSCSMLWGQSEEPIRFQRVLPKEDGRTKFDGPNPMQPTVVSWEKMIAQANHEDKELVFPIVLYLSSARLWNETKSVSYEAGVFGRTDAYYRCLDGKHGTELAFGYINMLQSVAVEENEGKPYPAYDAILNAINYALHDELRANERVIFSTRYGKDIVALKNNEGIVVPFTTLSDGYRNVIKIVLDIATRMCILNPYLQGEALQKTPGVVIIDEIDLSLHPTWQRRIIGILKTLFPRIQFICATHSPFIIQSLEDGELITLDREEKPLAEEYAGESIEDIAEDIMGVEMPQYSEKKKNMFDAAMNFFTALKSCASHERIEALRREMAVMEAEYSDNPAYLALIRQEFAAKKLEVEQNETNQ